jgi:branched-subunit amino acid ABC-type transport system permease component
VLASLGPITLLWFASSTDYIAALVFNGLMFAAASLAAQALLRGYYRPLIQRDARHRRMLACWGFVYVLVAIQLAWLLRPFIGAPTRNVEFLRPEAWDNAYVVVGRLVLHALGF